MLHEETFSRNPSRKLPELPSRLQAAERTASHIWHRLPLLQVRDAVFTAEPPQQVSAFVMSSRASLTCSATRGKPAAGSKMLVASFPGSSNKVEGVLPRVVPVGRTFCQRL